MYSTSLGLVHLHFHKAREAVARALASQTGTTNDISADLALKAALDAYDLPSEFWYTGGGCTARYVSFAPDGDISEHALHIVITDDASVDHPIAAHSGWLAMWYGPEFDGYADNELYNSEFSLQNPTLADMAHDSASCARAIRAWHDGAATQWTRNEVSLEGIAGPYRCQTRSEHWDGYCAPRFTHAVMRQICADTQTAHRAGEWNSPAHFEGNTVVIVTPSGRTEVLPDADGHYRPGAFYWPWTEYTDLDVAPVTELVRTIRWKYERQADSWTVITADHGWRTKVIDVLTTPSSQTAPHVADALRNVLSKSALSSYEVTADGPGDAAAAVRAHCAAARADRDPDAAVAVFDLPAVQLPGTSA
ncbi:hypothetical protein [Streptomyces sp. NPDC007088]|uniref:hypothetical protein n=1 Tax=Streptomyces sp. NPDC007088 TaxID=3364773 RepID=UPI0036C45591